jgi:predicted lipoprotein with Yx(FWY)xxD motif
VTVAAEDTPAAAETEPAGDEPTREPAESTLTVNVAEAGDLGTILTDADGLTLYTFANDTAGSGTSACVDACANVWPALTVESGEPTGPDQLTGELDTITRPDGATQVTYNGLPLYRFVNDQAPGDTNGHGVADIWFAATP